MASEDGRQVSSKHIRSGQPTPEQGFPRTYRVDVRTRHMVNGFLLLFVGFFVLLTAWQLMRTGSRPGSPRNLILGDVGVAILSAWLASSYNKRVILHQEAIEVAGWFCSRRLKFSEIRGWQTTGSSAWPSGYAYIFVPVDRGKRQLALPTFLHTDRSFREWLETIPKIRH